ncbi:hypothetical protein GCM10018966_060450 [Streptomyces yanii]
MTDVVEGAATEGADLAAGHAERGQDHRLDDDAGGERGRSVTADRAAQQGVEHGIGQRIGHGPAGRLKDGEQLGGSETAHPGIGHGRDVVSQVIGHEPVGHGGLDGGVRAQDVPLHVQAVKDPAGTGGGWQKVRHGTFPFGCRALNSPWTGLPNSPRAAGRLAPVAGKPTVTDWASLGDRSMQLQATRMSSGQALPHEAERCPPGQARRPHRRGDR